MKKSLWWLSVAILVAGFSTSVFAQEGGCCEGSDSKAEAAAESSSEHAGHAEGGMACCEGSESKDVASGHEGHADGGMDCCEGSDSKGESAAHENHSSEAGGETPASGGMACCEGSDTKGGHGKGMRGGGHGGGHREAMRGARTLVFNHTSIERTVEEIPGGVRTVNTTSDPSLLLTLQKHPREMAELYQGGGSVRHWDPLFVELAKVAGEIEMTFENLENGIAVTSTSTNPEVVKLIRAHAYKVNEFVARGHAAMRESTPIPDDYSRP